MLAHFRSRRTCCGFIGRLSAVENHNAVGDPAKAFSLVHADTLAYRTPGGARPARLVLR
jgi:hypothetical protein